MTYERVMHGAYRYHPLVGAGKQVLPREKGRRTCSQFEAWHWLNMEQWTSQIIPGDGGNYITLDVGEFIEHMPDVALEWNWSPATAERFVVELEAEQLVTPGLGMLVVDRICWPKRFEKRRAALPQSTRAAVLGKTSGLCVYCGVTLTVTQGQSNSYQPDHVLPVKLGGSDDVANLVPSCAACNAKKRAKTLVVFAGVKQ